jgi:hypothetical protein
MKILTVNGKDYTVRWRYCFSGGCGYTGTINQYRLPHLHATPEDLLFCAWEWAKAGEAHMACNLGKPEDIEAFLKC